MKSKKSIIKNSILNGWREIENAANLQNYHERDAHREWEKKQNDIYICKVAWASRNLLALITKWNFIQEVLVR